MPDNFHPRNPQDPYADYGPRNLYEFIAKHGVLKPANAGFAYSNLGLGLLGQALSNRAGTSYPELLKREVTEPLGLKDTVVKLSPQQEARFEAGHDAEHHPAHAWALDALAGAGAIRSTASDMLTYLEAELHPGRRSILGEPRGGLTFRHDPERSSILPTTTRGRGPGNEDSAGVALPDSSRQLLAQRSYRRLQQLRVFQSERRLRSGGSVQHDHQQERKLCRSAWESTSRSG